MLRHGLAGLNPSSSNAALILDLILSRSTTSRRNLNSPEHVRASLSTPRMQAAIAIARPPVAPQPRQMAAASRPGFLPSRPSRRTAVRAARDDSADQEPTFALAPSKPKSPTGEMAAYYLQMQPHLFREAVATAFQRIADARAEEARAEKEQAEAAAAAAAAGEGERGDADLVLYRRMAEVKRMEQMLAIEDLMYICILEKFQEIGVDMLPRVEPIEESSATLRSLTEGVHSREAIDMVKEHVLAVLGPASMAFSNTMIKMSKLQAAQVYAASIMFGYFLRRVDKRFQLAKQLGVLPDSREDAVARLERLFAQADEVESSPDPDTAQPAEPQDPDQPQASTSYGGAEAGGGAGGLVRRQRSALRRYVESFDQETMLQMARLVTVESAQLTERQTQALFGDIKALQRDMQEAVGQDAGSMEEIMARVQQAVADGKVESVVMTVGTQRRAVLEAVAYGCFLRDVECWVDGEWEQLLTPVAAASAAGEA
ncbi:hypothetical protein ABPG77_000577 [Micractinium sp. CCAP 211/92]